MPEGSVPEGAGRSLKRLGAGTSPGFGRPPSSDLQVIWWLATVPMLASVLLPWVLLRPNRLAAGEYLRLPPSALLAALVVACLPLLTARLSARRGNAAWAAALSALSASLALGTGVWLLGAQTQAALAGQPPIARASAASGVWVYLLGAGIAAYGARLSVRLGDPGGQGAGARWREGLAWLWLPAVAGMLASGHLSGWSVLIEGRSEGPRWVQELGQHLRLVGSGLGLATLIGVPLAVWAAGRERVAGAVLGLAGAVQTVPSLALLGLLIAPLSALSLAFPALRALGVSGIGTAPALSAMTLYALLPVVRNGVVALRGVPPGAVDAARGMGMSAAQRFWRVQLPLALPVWLSGVRQAAVLLVGVAAVAALIGAGGLGTYIFKGLQSAAADLILLGAVPAALLAIALDAALRVLEGWLGRRFGSIESAGTGESRESLESTDTAGRAGVTG